MRNSIIIINRHHPKSGISILGQCLRMLGLISIDDQAQTDISAIHELLFQDLDHSPIMAGPLPRGWMQTPGAERARQRINALIASGRNETNSFFIADPFLCRFMSLWAKAFQEVGLTPRFVLIVRHPWEACTVPGQGREHRAGQRPPALAGSCLGEFYAPARIRALSW